MFGLLWAVLRFVLVLAFGWVRCPWCGAWWPFWGRADYGPRAPWQCKSCGREI